MAEWVDWQRLRVSSVAGRIGIAVLAVAVASAARYGLELINPAILGLGPFYLAVLVAALIGGWLSGGLATLFGGFVFSFVFIPPQYQLTFSTPEHAIDMATFFVVSSLIVSLIEANQRQKALTQGFAPAVSRLRLWAAGLGLACGGLALSAGVALTTYEDAKALARSEFDRLADAHAQQLQAQLGEREAVARMVAAIFVAPGALIPNALAPIKEGFFSLAPDFAAVEWTPRVEPREIDAAIEVLAKEGVTRPAILGPDLQPLDIRQLNRPLYPILDIEPREDNAVLLGVDIGASPARLAALEASNLHKRLTATTAVRLMQDPNVREIVLFAPVHSADRAQPPWGFLGLTFRFDRLLAAEQAPLSIVIVDEGADEPDRLLFRSPRAAPDAQPWSVRTVSFGQRDWTVAYTPTSDLFGDARAAAVAAAAIGLGSTALLTGLLLYVLINFGRLQSEVAARRSAESILHTLIAELNHRVKNMLAVVQSIILRSLRPDMSVDEMRQVLLGRLHAMAHAVSMLSDSGWTVVSLRALLSPGVIPFSERIEVSGPDIEVEQRDGQAMALLFYELATNAVKHGALSAPAGKVRLQWELAGEAQARVFRMRWEENGGPPVSEPQHNGFGRTLIGRIAPETLGGKCTMQYPPTGFVYELEAPGRNFKLAGSGPPQELTRYLKSADEQIPLSP
jgi:two-component sensor histidine kinase/CHASE1-domain containing sensor protein